MLTPPFSSHCMLLSARLIIAFEWQREKLIRKSMFLLFLYILFVLMDILARLSIIASLDSLLSFLFILLFDFMWILLIVWVFILFSTLECFEWFYKGRCMMFALTVADKRCSFMQIIYLIICRLKDAEWTLMFLLTLYILYIHSVDWEILSKAIGYFSTTQNGCLK